MSPKMGDYTLDDDIARMAAHVAVLDAHHSEEIPEGRGLYGGVYLYSIPGGTAWRPGTVALNANRLHYVPIYVRTPITIDQVIIEVTGAAGAGNMGRIAIYEADVNWMPGALVVASAEFAIDAAVVVVTNIVATTLQEGRYLIGLNLEANVTLRSAEYGLPYMGFDPGLSASHNILIVFVAAAYGALPDPGTAWDTVVTGASGIAHPVWLRVLTP